MLSSGKLAALLFVQCCLCGVWAFGAWHYFHRQPLQACEAANAALRKEADALAVRAELAQAESWVLRGEYPAAVDTLSRARLRAQQAGLRIEQELDEVDGMLCRQDGRSRERLALMASRLVSSGRAGAIRSCGEARTVAAGVAAAGGVAVAEQAAAAAVVAKQKDEAVDTVKAKTWRKRGAVAMQQRERYIAVKAVKKSWRRKGGKSGARVAIARGDASASVAMHQSGAVQGSTRIASLEVDAAALMAAKKAVTEALLKRQGDIRACITSNVQVTGKANVTIRLVVSGQGVITEKRIEVSLPTPGGEAVRACVDGVVSAIKFPVVEVPEVRVVQVWTWRLGAAAGAAFPGQGTSHGT